MWCYEGFGWFGFGWVWMILFWGVIISFGIWLIIRLSNRDDSKTKVNHIEIAKERYAKGEISKEEFDQLKKDLS